MSGYIGQAPVVQATQTRQSFTATANQTSFSTLGYQENHLDVFLNGVKLNAADYTATNNSDIVLAAGCAVNDILEMVAFGTFEVANQSFTGTTVINTLTVTNDGTGSNIDADQLDGQHGAYYTGYTDTQLAALVDSSPAALNTLNELAAALGDDANFSTTVTNSIATKLPLAGGALTGALTTNSTIDGRDVAADGVTADAALPKAGGAVTGNVTFGDSNKAIFGAGSDLQIYHDGSHSFIQDTGTGNLRLRGSNINIESNAGHDIITGIEGGAATLYHNNAAKIATTATGIDVTGTVTSDALAVSAATNNYASITATNSNTRAGWLSSGKKSDGTEIKTWIRSEGDGGIGVVFTETNHNLGFATNNAAPQMTLDTSGNVGIGCTPSYKLDVASTVQIRAGESLRLQNAAGSSAATVQCAGAGGNSDLGFSTAGSERMRINSSGVVRIGGQTGTLQLGNDGTYYADIEWEYNNNELAFSTNSGANFTFNSGGSERMRISSAGIVTTPYQPAFDAYHAGGSYASGTTVTSLDLNAVRLNRGGHYSTSNDRFIAPVAGVYMFYYRTIVNGAYTNLHVRFRKNSTVVIGGGDTHVTTASGWNQFHTQVTVQLAANDFVQVEHTTSTNIYGDSYQSFNGHLIG